jgi:hypothetical protein
MPLIKTILLKSIACLVAACVLEAAGAALHISALRHPEGFINLIPSFILALLVLSALERFNRYLEARFDWMAHPGKRFLLQALGGTALYVLMFLLVVLTFSFKQGVNIFCVPWLIHMSATVLALVMVANAGFVLTTLYQKLQQADRILKKDFPNYMRLL